MLRRVLVVLAGVLVLGGLGAGSASAVISYPFDGQLLPASGVFSTGLQPGSVAVDDSDGRTYVADGGGVDVFETSSGAQLAGLDGLLTPDESFGESPLVAADNGTGDVYVLDNVHNVVDVFDASGGYLCQITGRSTPSASECNGVAGSDTPAHGLNSPTGIAVDQATGDVYVIDANDGAVDVFSAAGAYLPAASISLASIPGGFSTFYTKGIAVDSFNGNVYVSDSGAVVVYVFNAAGVYQATWTGANTPADSFGGGYVSVAADDVSGDVYVTDSQHKLTDVFGPAGEYLTRFAHPYTEPTSTAVDQATGRVYVGDSGSVGGNGSGVDIFGPAVFVPEVATGAASGIHATGATLAGSVNPDGVPVTGCHFEYGTTTAYGQSAPCVPAPGSIPADSSEHPVSAVVTGLVPGVTYHYRLVAANANGANDGEDATFQTTPPPSIEGAAAVNVTGASADLTARIDPNGTSTAYRFEWGTSTAYGTSVPVPDADIGAGTGGVPVDTHLSGLSANTTYHWRIVAANESTTTGSDHTFIYDTSGGGLPDGRAYEMVTPPDKNGALPGVTLRAYPCREDSRPPLANS